VAEERSRHKRRIGIDVLTAAQQRIAWTFDTFTRIYLSGPSGKDSGVMMHLVCQEARRRGQKVGILYVDLEAQYRVTIEWVTEMFALYADCIEPFWVALPLHLRNAVSQIEPYWVCWDSTAKERWVREPEKQSITDPSRFEFFRSGMEFEEFIDEFGKWYGGQEITACFVGIRSDESLNRWRTIASQTKRAYGGRQWTSRKGATVVNVYSIYDWRTEDIWTYYGKTGLPANRLYDMMHKAGVPISQQRICQPYGDDQRRGLWLYQVIEPESWARVVARVAGANHGALYAGKRGNILGNAKVSCPAGHTWESYATFLLESMPPEESDHYRDKIAVFLRWWGFRGYAKGIPDESDPVAEAARKLPSWRRICKCILKNDRLCKGLSFSQNSPEQVTYLRYKKVMANRRAKWGIYG
jgi:predicted phosphoadenosine phosphosulfate sulfurtransferase